MYTALRSTSQTLSELLHQGLEADPNLASFFNAGLGGTMVVSLATPQEMVENQAEGLSVWLYRIAPDAERLNDPLLRVSPEQLRKPPLPLRLYYLVTPVTNRESRTGPETEQVILGKVLQILHDHPTLRGTDLQGEFSGTGVELNLRLQPMTLEEITRVWDALEGSYQLSVSYEVGVVNIDSALEPERVRPVLVSLPEYGVITGSEPG